MEEIGAMKHVAGVVLAVLLVSGAWADGFRNPPDTAAALGKSGKHIVWVDDASAVFYNPANLVDVPSRQVQASALLGYSHADYTGPSGRTETERPWGLLPAFSLAWPLAETGLAFGLGSHVPYGRQTHWDSDGPFPIFSRMSVMDFSPQVAWRVSDSVSIGAGLDIYYGRLQFRQYVPFAPPPAPPGKASADADGYAVGANAGITWRITERQRLALTCRSPFDLKFKGDMDVAGFPSPPFPPTVPESDLDTTFKFPTIIALGYGIQLTETIRVEANVEWLQYSRNKTMRINGGANDPLVGVLGLSNSPQNWNDTWTFGLGGEWRFAQEWTFRTGYLYLQSPVPDSTFTPLILDVDQSVVSVGLGYEHGRHGIDLAYALGIFEKRRAGVTKQDHFDFDGHLVALSYTYSF